MDVVGVKEKVRRQGQLAMGLKNTQPLPINNLSSAELIWENIQIYLHLLSFLKTEMVKT